MKRIDSSHSKESTYGKGFDSSSYQSLLVPGSHVIEAEDSAKGNGSDDGSDAQQKIKYDPPYWTQKHENLSKFNPRIMETGREMIHNVDKLKLDSLDEGRKLLEHGTPPTMHQYSIKGVHDNTAYKKKIEELQKAVSPAKQYINNTKAHLNDLQQYSHPDEKMRKETKLLLKGLSEAHSLATSDHPHGAFTDHDLSQPVHDHVKADSLAAINETYGKVTRHLRKHG
jgi:hypothetical protein